MNLQEKGPAAVKEYHFTGNEHGDSFGGSFHISGGHSFFSCHEKIWISFCPGLCLYGIYFRRGIIRICQCDL